MSLKTVLLSVFFLLSTACGKQEVISSSGSTPNGMMAQDIAKIREIKEQEQKDKAIQKAKSDQFGKDMKQGSEAPRIEFK